MGKKIYLTEEQFKDYLRFTIAEGASMTDNGNGGLRLNFNRDMTDAANNEFDSRVFGSRKNILNGDKTLSGHYKNLSDTVADANVRIARCKSAIEYVRNGFNGKINYSTPKFLEKLGKIRAEAESNGYDPQETVITWLEKNIERDEQNFSMLADKYGRATTSSNKDRIARYNVGRVPGTNIKVIALFTMNDFNFSDAMKHGNARQNNYTDAMLGIDKADREKEDRYVGKGIAPMKRIPVTYDDGVEPDIQNNFSLGDEIDGINHFKRSYGYQDKKLSQPEFMKLYPDYKPNGKIGDNKIAWLKDYAKRNK